MTVGVDPGNRQSDGGAVGGEGTGRAFGMWPAWVAPVAGLFLLTALVGVWAAYDRSAAWPRFGLLAAGLVGALGLAGMVGRRIWSGGVVVWAMAGICLYALATDPALGLPIRAVQTAGWPRLHPNALGGALALGLPLLLAQGYDRWRERRVPGLLGCGLVSLLTLGLLLLTGSRGAWIGLGAGGLVSLAPLVAGPGRPRLRLLRLSLAVWSATLCLIFVLAVAVPATEPLLRRLGADDSILGRVLVWRDMTALIGDTPFTGSGPGVTTMVYSTYGLMLHVPFWHHAHNTFLQVAVEQGVPGLVILVALLGCGFSGLLAAVDRSGHSAHRLAILAGLVIGTTHGLLDAELYSSLLAPLFFLPMGLAWGEAPRPAVWAGRFPVRWVLAGLMLSLGLWFLPPVRGAFDANLGAVAQQRAELSIYRWPEWPGQDALRRSARVDLTVAEAYYRAALALDGHNVTANRRLGQIALSRGEYGPARQRLEAAYGVAPRQRAVALLLGEVYAVAGEGDGALVLWHKAQIMPGQVQSRMWWYQYLGDAAGEHRIMAVSARLGRHRW